MFMNNLKLLLRFNTTSLYEEVSQTMLSGNLINLKIYSEVGPFMEDLFLDYVDIEYYCRLQAAGYKIVQINRALIQHNWGNINFINVKNRSGLAILYTPRCPLIEIEVINC